MKKNLTIAISVMMILLVFIMPVNAEDTETEPSEPNTSIQIVLITDGDLEAFFNGEAGGDITYYIDGVEISSEFLSLWNALTSLKRSLGCTSGLANDAYDLAEGAFSYADQAFSCAHNNGHKIGENVNTLNMHSFVINDTRKNVLVMGNEIVAFEGAYFDFVNETNTTLSTHGENLGVQKAELDSLQAKINDLNAMMVFFRNALIGFGLIVGCLYVLNRRYPFRNIFSNNGIDRSPEKKYKIVDFVKPSEGKTKAKRSGLKVPRVKRNPQKSPIRFLFSFLNINNKF